MNKEIFIDLDGVLFNSIEPFIDFTNFHGLTNFTLNDMTEYDAIPKLIGNWCLSYFSQDDYYDEVEPYAGSRTFLEELQVLGYKINLITVSPNHMIERKNDMITMYFFGLFDSITHVEKSSDKVKFIGDNDIFIEDYSETLRERKRKSDLETFDQGKSILFNYEGMNLWACDKSTCWINLESYDAIIEHIKLIDN